MNAKPGDQGRKLADQIERQKGHDKRRVAELRGLADRLDQIAADYAGTLTDGGESVNSKTMPDNPLPAPSFSRFKKNSKALREKHRFAVALEKRQMTLAAWCRSEHVHLQTASSWMSSGNSGRRIPWRWAARIELWFGDGPDGKPLVPATVETWKNGIHFE